MKVLMYHWTQDNLPKLQGGGIQLYQRDILQTLLGYDEIQLTVLSSGSGDLYDFYRPSIRIERLDSSTPALERFGLINSPVPAPASFFFRKPFVTERLCNNSHFF